jgi:geranylgeranyl pyrophosphate synthase
LPVLVALHGARGAERAALLGMLQKWEARRFPDLLSILNTHGALDSSCEAVQEHLAVARQELGGLPDSPSRAALAGLTDYLAHQTEALALPA